LRWCRCTGDSDIDVQVQGGGAQPRDIRLVRAATVLPDATRMFGLGGLRDPFTRSNVIERTPVAL
jgi:hypothetical protein